MEIFGTYVNETIIALGILVFWFVVSIISAVFFQHREAKVPKQSYIIFLCSGGILAVFRVWMFWYLYHDTERYYDFFYNSPLKLFVQPEVRFVAEFSIENVNLTILVCVIQLIVGSFLWAFPIMFWLAPRKPLP